MVYTFAMCLDAAYLVTVQQWNTAQNLLNVSATKMHHGKHGECQQASNKLDTGHQILKTFLVDPRQAWIFSGCQLQRAWLWPCAWVNSAAWLSGLWGFGREVRWSLGADEPGTKRGTWLCAVSKGTSENHCAPCSSRDSWRLYLNSPLFQEHWGLLLSKEVIFDQISIPCLQRPAVLNGAPGRGLTGEGNDKNLSACQPCNGWEMKACDSLGKRNEIDSAWGGG